MVFVFVLSVGFGQFFVLTVGFHFFEGLLAICSKRRFTLCFSQLFQNLF